LGENRTGNYTQKGGETVAIKWSAVKVSEAIDKVEQQVTLAEPFLDEAKTKAQEARGIPNLPSYMDDRFVRLISQIERIDNVKGAIESARSTIPSGAIEEEQRSTKHGRTQSLI
jgi:hypothetical protein